jgi:hypothetical protein
METEERHPAGGRTGALRVQGPLVLTHQAAPRIRRADTGLPAGSELPFDIYQRYRLVGDIVERLAAGRRLRVLDVGGRTGVLRTFLPAHAVALVDMQPSAEAGLVLGDGSRLPFAAGAFDVVVSCDTLEHVPQERRAAFLDECARAARRAVVIAGPYRHERVEEAEETLRAFLRHKVGIEHRYLEEHKQHGLPARAEVEQQLARHGLSVTSIGHGNLERWLALLCLSMYMEHDPHLQRVAAGVYRFYNSALYASDRCEPVYRHALVALAPGERRVTAEELFGPALAPEGSLEPFVHLAAELFAFDRERDVYEAERDRLRAVNDGLVQDLAGHKRHAAALEQDLAGHKRHAAALEQDLAGHRAALAAAQCDLQGHRAVLEELREERAERLDVLADQERDLAGHRSVCAELRAELEARRGQAAELAAELSRTRTEAAAERAELERERAALRGELASRWRSLMRVLRPTG